MPSVGLLFLEDLHDRVPATTEGCEWAERRGGLGPLLPPTVTPPPAVVVVARESAWSSLEISVGWLRLAARVVIVVDSIDSVVAADDVELQALVADQRARLAAALGDRVTLIAIDQAGLDAAIERALALASAHEPAPWPALPPIDPIAAVPPGPWLSWRPPGWGQRAPDLFDVVRHLAPAVCSVHGRPAVLDTVIGARIDLETGQQSALPGLRGSATAWCPIAVSPDGESWLTTSGRPSTWSMAGAAPSPAWPGGWGQPIGIDPAGRVAWTGGRARFDWRVMTGNGPVYWTPSSHDWPCGHAKKLYGNENNEPLLVQLSADASACLSIYQHDAMLTPGLPLRWRAAGSYAVAERAYGEPRAMLFERDPAHVDDADRDNEDLRERFAIVALGPSPELRYVVGLSEHTHRFVGDTLARIGGPGGGWIVCSEDHRITQRGTGRLLGGCDRWVVIEQDGSLRRQDLVSGAIEELGAVDRPIAAAVPLAGSPNIVVCSLERGVAVRVL